MASPERMHTGLCHSCMASCSEALKCKLQLAALLLLASPFAPECVDDAVTLVCRAAARPCLGKHPSH